MKRLRVRRDDTGAGLVEVMVGMAIFSLLSGLLATFSISLIRKGAGTTNRVTSVNALRVAMDEISKGLRIAVRPEQLNSACTAVGCDVTLYAPSATSVTFYANHGDAAKARLTTYTVEEDLPKSPGTARLVAQLTAPSTPATLAVPTCTTGCVSRTLARGLVWPVPATPFTYAGSSCSGFAAPTSPTPSAVSTSVACVAIDLRVKGARDNAGTSVTSTVFLPNSVIGR